MHTTSSPRTNVNMFAKTLFAFFMHMLLSSTGYGQTYTPVPYDFPDEPMGNMFYQSPTKLRFVSLASNGYGQWTVNDKDEWFLLTQKLKLTFDSMETPTSGPGIIDKGSLITKNGYSRGLGEVKVVANLNGSVRYVWQTISSPDSNGFVINGFNDFDFPSTDPLQKQIDIRLPSIPNTIDKRQVIKSPIYYCPATFITPFKFFGNEQKWKDEFDVAIDAKYLYITYAIRIADTITKQAMIGVTAVELSTGNTVAGYPQFVAKGRRPTISCDVRKYPIGPTFDLAYIDTIEKGRVHHVWYDTGAFVTDAVLPLQYTDSSNQFTYQTPYHARVVTGSVLGMPLPAKGVFIIFHEAPIGANIGHLVFHRIRNNNLPDQYAQYIDGDKRAHAQDPPIPAPPPNSTFYDVLDNPIQAVSNPYDGESTQDNIEFHCIYQLYCPALHDSIRYPLLIGRADGKLELLNKKYIWAGNQHLWTRSPSPINGFPLIAANQTGIHCRWSYEPEGFTTTSPITSYKRSNRRFDEPIEEHTLAIDTNYIGDGRNHGGNLGPLMLSATASPVSKSGVSMLLYSGTAFQNNGCLIFNDSGSYLTVGPTGFGTHGAYLTALQNIKLIFIDASQGVKIGPQSILNCYDTDSLFVGGGNLYLNGSSCTYLGSGTSLYVDSLVKPAILNIHGGALLNLGNGSVFNSSYAIINQFYETKITDQTGNPLSSMSGRITSRGFVGISATKFNTFAPSKAKTYNALTVTAPGKLTVGLSHIKNTPDTAKVSFRVQGATQYSQFGEVKLIQGRYEGMGLSVASPVRPVIIEDADFVAIPDTAIKITRGGDSWSSGYDSIYITGNEFHKFTHYDSTKNVGIFLENFANQYPADTSLDMPAVLVQANDFTTATGKKAYAAILTRLTTAGIAQNIITGEGYLNGIMCVGNIASTAMTESFICSNYISGCDVSGITTAFWDGYIKLTQIDSCKIAHLCDEFSKGGVVFSKYSDCFGPGIKAIDYSVKLDLSGVHSDANNNYPAYDTLLRCNLDNDTSSGQIELVQGSSVLLGKVNDTLPFFGQNNIIRPDTTSNLIICTGYSTNIGNIDSNYFGDYTPIKNATYTVTDPLFPNVRFNRVDSVLTDTTNKPFGVSCTSGIPASAQPSQSQQNYTSPVTDTCEQKFGYAHSALQGGKDQEAYDKFKDYIETCYYKEDAFHGFGYLNSANEYRSKDLNRYHEYREWLKKVLYYSKDTFYYCQDARSIIYTTRWFDSLRGFDSKGAIAICQYLIESGKCPYDTTNLKKGVKEQWDYDYRYWQDTVTDPTQTPYDSTLPTLEDLDLGILRGLNNVTGPVGGSSKQAVSSFRAETNPFSDETVLHFTLNDAAYVKIELFDILGKRLDGYGGRLFPEGKNSISIDGTSLPEGILYARLTTLSGEVKTIQLRHY